MTKWILDNLLQILSLTVIPAVIWFVTKRHFQTIELKQASTNVEGSITDNVVKNLDVYQRMFQDLDEKLIKAENKISELEAELDSINAAYKLLKEKYERSNNN